jgi:hypothetical protein
MAMKESEKKVKREESSADADMGLGLPAKRGADDPSEAPEEEGSATQVNSNRKLVNEHRTDESGAPDDE